MAYSQSAQRAYLANMGIDVWRERVPAAPAQAHELPPWQLDCSALSAWVCQEPVCWQRTPRALGSGLLVLSNGYADESAAGFSDEAGTLFGAMLKAIDLAVEDVAWGQLGAGDAPLSGERDLCAVRVILLMLALPTACELDAYVGRRALEGVCCQIPFIASLHPAYLLAHSAAKRAVWEDLKRVSSLLQSS